MLIYSKMPGARWWTLATVAACGAVVLNNAVYFQGGPPPRFLLEKADLSQTAWWLAAFYCHVIAASVCLATGTLLMFPKWTRRYPAWHRRIGYVYVNAVLWMAAPTGVVLTLTAKGGIWGTIGFAVAGIFWWISTWTGYRQIRRSDITAHVCAMVRSYCWALSAPAFRVIQTGLFLLEANDDSNYVVSLWLSIAASVWLAESFLNRFDRRAISYASITSPQVGVVA